MALSKRQRSGEVLLERHVDGERVVERQVDDAESALAQHALDLELGDPRALRKGIEAIAGTRLPRRVATGTACVVVTHATFP